MQLTVLQLFFNKALNYATASYRNFRIKFHPTTYNTIFERHDVLKLFPNDIKDILYSKSRTIVLRGQASGTQQNKPYQNIVAFSVSRNLFRDEAIWPFIGWRNAVKKVISVKKPHTVCDEPVYLLPYYHTQFGHFTAEVLGAILFWFHSIQNLDAIKTRKLVVVIPDRQLFTCLQTLIDDKLVLYYKPDDIINNDIKFVNAVQLPMLSPTFQIGFLKKFLNEIDYTSVCPQLRSNRSHPKVFLTDNSEDRIVNIKPLIQMLKDKGFYVLNPRAVPFLEACYIIANAKYLITEDGSLSFRALITRRHPYLILSSEGYDRQSQQHFTSGGALTSIDYFLIDRFICKKLGTRHQGSHPISSIIDVPIEKLSIHLDSLNQFFELQTK